MSITRLAEALITSNDVPASLERLHALSALLDEAFDDAAVALCESLRGAGVVHYLMNVIGNQSLHELHAMALLVLGNMCSEAVDPRAGETRAMVKEQHGFEMLLPHLFSADPTILTYALGAIQNTCRDRSYLEFMQQLDIIAQMQHLALSENEHIAQFAKGSIANMHAMVMQQLSEDDAAHQQPPDLEYMPSIDSLEKLARAAGTMKDDSTANRVALAAMAAITDARQQQRLCAGLFIKAMLQYHCVKLRRRRAAAAAARGAVEGAGPECVEDPAWRDSEPMTMAEARTASAIGGAITKESPSASPSMEAPGQNVRAAVLKPSVSEKLQRPVLALSASSLTPPIDQATAATILQARQRGRRVRNHIAEEAEFLRLMEEAEEIEAKETEEATLGSVEAAGMKIAGGTSSNLQQSHQLAAERESVETTKPTGHAKSNLYLEVDNRSLQENNSASSASREMGSERGTQNSDSFGLLNMAVLAAEEAESIFLSAQVAKARASQAESVASTVATIAQSIGHAEASEVGTLLVRDETGAALQQVREVLEKETEEGPGKADSNALMREVIRRLRASVGDSEATTSFFLTGVSVALPVDSASGADGGNAILRLQAGIRGYHQRELLRRHAAQKSTSAIAIQRVYRGHCGRLRARVAHEPLNSMHQRRQHAAARIQARSRGRSVRLRSSRTLADVPNMGESGPDRHGEHSQRAITRIRMRYIERKRGAEIIAIQRIARGRAARRAAVARRKLLEQDLKRVTREKAATNIAAAYRGWRGRRRVRRVRSQLDVMSASWADVHRQNAAAGRRTESIPLPPSTLSMARSSSISVLPPVQLSSAKSLAAPGNSKKLSQHGLSASSSLPLLNGSLQPKSGCSSRKVSPTHAARRAQPSPPSPNLSPPDLLRFALQQHAARVCGLFTQWDEDGNGHVSRAEFNKAMPDLLIHWGLPKLATAHAVIDEVFVGLDYLAKGEIAIPDLQRRLLALKPTAVKLLMEAKNPFPLRTAAPRAPEVEELRQPMRNTPPIGIVERERAEINLAKLRSQARGHDVGLDAQFLRGAGPPLKQRLDTHIRATYSASAEFKVGGSTAPKGMTPAEYKLHKAKIDAWASRPKQPGRLDPRIDPLARFFSIPDPDKIAEVQSKRTSAFRPVR